MAFTAAQKRQYWAKKNADNKKREANKKPFIPLSNPSTFQRAVFNDIANESHNTVIEACAGSGKSTTLINGLTYIPKGSKVALCAFGRDPAEELQDRCPQVEGVEIEINTTHSFGGRALKRRFPNAILDKDKLKKIVIGEIGDPYADPEKTNEELEEKLENICKCTSLAKQGLSLDEDSIIELMDKFNIDFMSEEERKRITSADVIESLQRQFVSTVLDIIEKCKRQTYTYDFDDMLFLVVALNLPMEQFDFVLPDEVQDFNACQIKLIKKMVRPGGRIIAGGDSNQAIFLFRNADENSIPDLISSLNAKVLPLSITYRCAKAIVRYVKGIVPNLPIEAGPTNAEGSVNLGVKFNELNEKVKPGDFIISRLNAPLMPIALHLLRKSIPCQIMGRDIGGYLKFFLWKSGCKDIPSFINWIDEWEQKQIEILTKRKRKPSNMEGMIENIRDRSQCLTMLALDCTSMEEMGKKITKLFSDESKVGFVILGSTHKLKGKESDTVWMLNSTYKPGKSVEENNLLYVACTRSKFTLNVVEGNLRD